MDPDYIKRLQVNVSKNASQTVKNTADANKDIGTAMKDKEKLIQRRSADVQNIQKNITQNNGDNTLSQCTGCDTTKFKTKLMSTTSKRVTSQRPTILVPKLKLRSATRSFAPDKYVNASLSRKSTSANTPSTQVQSQRNYDDIETILAKITSSQRTICSSIDSLM